MRRSATSLRGLKPYDTPEQFNSDLAALQYGTSDAYAYNPVSMQIEKVENRKAVINANTGKHISFVGKNYNFVQPSEHIPATLQALSKNDIEFVPRNLHVVGGGEAIIVVLDLPQFKLFKGTEEEQTTQFIYKFFYNAKGADHGLFGLLRMICTNGAIAFDAQMEYKLRHSEQITQKAVQAINMYRDFDGVFKRTEETIERFAHTRGLKDRVADYIGDGEQSLSTVFKGERWAAKLLTKWQQEGEPTNWWDIYNMETNLISHELGSSYSSKLGYMHTLNKETAKWTQLLGEERMAA